MANDEWRTPPALFAVLNDRHRFTIDVAATATNTLCPNFITAEQDALGVPWGPAGGVAWCNPPYSNGMIPLFLRRGIELIAEGGVREIAFLIRADVSTRYWHELVLPYASEVLFPNGRVNFLTADGEADKGSGTKGARSPNFASAVIVMRRQVEGIIVPITYGTITYDRGKRYGDDEGPDRLPGDTVYRRQLPLETHPAEILEAVTVIIEDGTVERAQRRG